jgi:hypothetical protein
MNNLFKKNFHLLLRSSKHGNINLGKLNSRCYFMIEYKNSTAFRIVFNSLWKKSFGAKFKTTVKNLEIDNNNLEMKTKSPSEKEITSTKSTTEKNSQKSPSFIQEKENKDKTFLIDLRNSIINLDESRPKRIPFWIFLHSLPALVLLQNIGSLLWVYQIFWIGSSIGLNLSAFEFYADEKEKKVMLSHLNFW